ncbi:MAG TPA: pirin family protein [Candidatus Acidoferrales bacterium]|nr:pirin family protein [Candidatus Acidoferrales bacterium]
MLQVIPDAERYRFQSDWLDTRWHFSFDHYHDPKNISFGPLRVFNDDVIAAGGGFPMHSHREMEIVTYVISGALEHRDSLGNTGQIRPGEIQRMSAGTGIRHSEYNASETDPLHLVQLWILPAEEHLSPSWEQRQFSLEARTGKLLPIAIPVSAGSSSKEPGGGKLESSVVHIHQDAFIFTSLLRPGESVTHRLASGRRAYLFLISGQLRVNGKPLRAGDQARISGETSLQMDNPAGSAGASDFLLLDMP